MPCLNDDTVTKRCGNFMRQMEQDLESRARWIKDEQPANVLTIKESVEVVREVKGWRLESAIIEFQATAPRPTEQHLVILIVLSFTSLAVVPMTAMANLVIWISLLSYHCLDMSRPTRKRRRASKDRYAVSEMVINTKTKMTRLATK